MFPLNVCAGITAKLAFEIVFAVMSASTIKLVEKTPTELLWTIPDVKKDDCFIDEATRDDGVVAPIAVPSIAPPVIDTAFEFSKAIVPRLSNIFTCETVRSKAFAVDPVLFPLIVFAGICERVALVNVFVVTSAATIKLVERSPVALL